MSCDVIDILRDSSSATTAEKEQAAAIMANAAIFSGTDASNDDVFGRDLAEAVEREQVEPRVELREAVAVARRSDERVGVLDEPVVSWRNLPPGYSYYLSEFLLPV